MDKNYSLDKFEKTEHCGTCIYWNSTRIDDKDTSICTKGSVSRRQHYSDKCNKFEKSKEKYNNKNIYEKIYKRNNPNCYITTVIVTLLGNSDNSYDLNVLRWFRDNILQFDVKHINILAEYDKIGPNIANKLVNDENSLLIAKYLEFYFIKPVVNLITTNQYDSAIDLYICMIQYLKSLYNIDSVELSDIYSYENNTNPEDRGHGSYQKIRK